MACNKAKEIFNYQPPDESIRITAWFNLALSVITLALSVWNVAYFAFNISLINAIFHVILLLILFLCIYFNKRYIDGIKARDHKQMELFRITFVVESLIDFVYYNIVSCIIMLPIAVYMFKIFNTLYIKIRDEDLAVNPTTPNSGRQISVVVDSDVSKNQGLRY